MNGEHGRLPWRRATRAHAVIRLEAEEEFAVPASGTSEPPRRAAQVHPVVRLDAANTPHADEPDGAEPRHACWLEFALTFAGDMPPTKVWHYVNRLLQAL